MPKALTPATFVRSRTAFVLYCLIAGALALACALWLDLVWAGVVFVVLVALGWQQSGRVPPPLRTGDHDQWEQYCQGQWHKVVITAPRVGPLLCEVVIRHHHYALWYDMLPPEHFRQLRRALLNLSSKATPAEERSQL